MSTQLKEVPADANPQVICVMPVQSAGVIGKSALSDVQYSFALTTGVPARLTDADAEHRTISARYPECDQVSLHDADDMLRLMKKAGNKGHLLEIIDMPAQKTDYILAAFEQFNLLKLMAANRVRLTVMLFVADIPAAEQSLAKVVEAFDQDVDYLIVKNPARFKSRHYEGSELQKELLSWGAKEITLPTITQTTLDEIQRAHEKLGRWLSLAEAAIDSNIDVYSQHELQYFLGVVYGQLYEARHLLFPAQAKATWKPAVQKKAERKKLNLGLNLGGQ